MKSSDTTLSLEPLEFILRHPWLFVYPIVIISSITFSYISTINSSYKSVAVLSFESGSRIVASSEESNANLSANVLYLGDNIRYVINEAWPGIKEDSSPTVYYKLSDLLRNRVQIKYDTPKNLMTISFQTE
ncbi:MAG: hypothetical protein WC419_07400, partial [Candidatus Omnitrophota bacterium]